MRLFGLIGYPLSHSFSAKYFADKFVRENISDCEYQLFPLKSISELTSVIALEPDLQGFNVTIPYKIAILPYLNHISAEVAGVGASNCIRVSRGASGVELIGYNTDIYGFRESLLPLLKPYHTHALVLGTGGAAKAVCYTLQELGIRYSLVSRTGDEKGVLTYRQLSKKMFRDYMLIINTTPVGMYPEPGNCPDIPYSFLTNKHLLYDLVYNPIETLFMLKGLEAGAVVKNGLEMLELQAQKSWEIWNQK